MASRDFLSISWYPSDGRGEYEFSTRSSEVVGKKVVVRLPEIDAAIDADVRLKLVSGKRRLRRGDKNDRKNLNLPNLLAALAVLPQPKRARLARRKLPLRSGEWAVGVADLTIQDVTNDSVVCIPETIQPYGYATVDARTRFAQLIANSGHTVARKIVSELKQGSRSSHLGDLAEALHSQHPWFNASASNDTPASSIADLARAQNLSGEEGRRIARTHWQIERDRGLVLTAKRLFREEHGGLFCEACKLRPQERYAGIDDSIIEAHHKVPLGSLKAETTTHVDDFVMLCPTCHRVVHRIQDCSLNALKELIGQA